MKRNPEPELMDSETQTLAYAGADFNESNSLFVGRFLERFADLPEYGRLADLGRAGISRFGLMALPWEVVA